ncbi:MAG TPA: hypothetical protein VFD38_01190 [Myxococcaceae bacterium]|nr:hypothetical protein [Myxococcaceae bacterium]
MLHELGHRLVFWLTGTPARMGFQRVDPTVPVSDSLWLCGKAGGPLVTLVLSLVLVAVARRHGSFAWATAAFTQASLRLFPLTVDLVRALRGAPPFSDEGELIRALDAATPVRVTLVLSAWAVFGTLSFLAARTFPFRRHRWLGVAAVYLAGLAVGIGAALADELLGIHGR